MLREAYIPSLLTPIHRDGETVFVRKTVIRYTILILTLLSLFSSCSRRDLPRGADLNRFAVIPGANDSGLSENLPEIDPWLMYANHNYADWLGIKYFGKFLREPINIIIIDRHSETPDLAVEKLMQDCHTIGYEEEYGHSSGYLGRINGSIYHQIPDDRHMAFANKDFFRTNNHGRIIGPAFYNNSYIFIAGFSTERPSLIKGFHHSFVSFNRARDDFAVKMDESPHYRVAGYVEMKNALILKDLTTADHDGRALVIETR